MSVKILVGDCRAVLRSLPADSVHCVVTSPPYWGLRDYGIEGQLGLEPTLGEHLAAMVEVFREVRRVLRPDGTVWLNYGDCYATAPNGRSAADTKAAGNDDRTFRDKPFSTVGAIGGKRVTAGKERTDVDVGGWGARDDGIRWRGGGFLKAKDLCMVPNRLAIALQDDGWWVRSEIIWHKPNPMPESIKDRPGTSHEKIWLLSKSERYFYDDVAVRQPLAQASIERLGQPTLEEQEGSTRANGGTRANRPMKAVRFGGNKGGGEHGSSARTKSGNEWRPRATPPRHAGAENSDRSGLDEVGRGERNLRNVWTIPTAAFAEAHFATFPPALVEPCIKAGTSEHGVCLSCGAPWVRQVDREVLPPPDRQNNNAFKHDSMTTHGEGATTLRNIVNRTTGVWVPSCKCPQDPDKLGRAVVLDPFGGSGTVGMVASGYGRDAILAELNPEYAALAAKRIGLFAQVIHDPYLDGWPEGYRNAEESAALAVKTLAGQQ